MKRLSTAILAFGIALIFVLYMVTYTVAYNEIAIITTFGSAEKPVQADLEAGKDSGSVIQEPGLKFKWPWPIQRVETYPTQLQVLSDTPEELSLNDGNTIIINFSLTWKIKDPLAFSIAHEDMDAAKNQLRAQMRDLRSIISDNYSFDQLVNEDSTKVELDELEQKIADELARRLSDNDPNGNNLNWGIEVAKVTVGKMLYAESTAASVNTRMTATQERKAQEIRSQGDSQAAAIVAEAESISKRLKDFADTVASEIEVQGREEANAILSKYADKGASEDLAIYLRQLEAVEKMLANRTTFVLNAKTFTPLDVLVYGHGEPGNLSRLFSKEASAANPPAAPLTFEAQQAELIKAMQTRIETLENRIAELLVEIETLDRDAPPLPVIEEEFTASESEARP